MPAPRSDALFFHNPPTDTGLLRELFVGRAYELQLLNERIPGSYPGTIRAIHGYSRVGKSHLALHFLAGLQDVQLISIKAASGRKARLILRELYAQLRQRIWDVKTKEDRQTESLALLDPTTNRPLPVHSIRDGVSDSGGVSAIQVLEDALARIDRFDPLIQGGASSAEHTLTDSTETSVNANLGIVGSGLSSSVKQTQGLGGKLTLAAPDEYGLTHIIGELCQDLFFVTGQRVLIYVDDVDLLDTGPSSPPDEVVLLVRCLHQLSQCQDVRVATSLRTRHLQNADKEFSEVVLVEPMSHEELRQVYERHIKTFNSGTAVMDEACLDELITHVKGKVGTFLRLCSQLRDWGLRHRPDLCLTPADLIEFYKAQVRQCLQVPDNRPYIERIKEALKLNTMEVEVDAGVLATPIVGTLLEEPLEPGVPKAFDISPLAGKTLRAMYPSVLSPIPAPILDPSSESKSE